MKIVDNSTAINSFSPESAGRLVKTYRRATARERLSRPRLNKSLPPPPHSPGNLLAVHLIMYRARSYFHSRRASFSVDGLRFPTKYAKLYCIIIIYNNTIHVIGLRLYLPLYLVCTLCFPRTKCPLSPTSKT